MSLILVSYFICSNNTGKHHLHKSFSLSKPVFICLFSKLIIKSSHSFKKGMLLFSIGNNNGLYLRISKISLAFLIISYFVPQKPYIKSNQESK